MDIAAQFGITFNADLIHNESASIQNKREWIKASSELFALEDIGLFAASTIKTSSPAKPLASALAGSQRDLSTFTQAETTGPASGPRPTSSQ